MAKMEMEVILFDINSSSYYDHLAGSEKIKNINLVHIPFHIVYPSIL